MRTIAYVVLVIGLVTAAARRADADCGKAMETKAVPLPVWSTDPNEGNTWGVMPVFVRVCPEDQRTQWIFAPGVTYNSIIHYTGTLRLYAYPDTESALSVIASMSTRINYNFLVTWQRMPVDAGTWTDEGLLRVEKSAFARFFGIGADTMMEDEASYTRERAIASWRRGLNLGGGVNVGASAGIERDAADDEGVPGLPLAPEKFATAPGMMTAPVVGWQGLDVRYDTRGITGDFADRGVRLEAGGAVVEGLAHSPTFYRANAQVRGVWPELDWLAGGARAAWLMVSDSDAPFLQQSSLGGSYLLRGFGEGRFYDRQAWEIETEQRIRILQTSMFGVITDWRVDPFIAAGQVFDQFSDAFAKTQLAVGVGLRAYVHPNLVARIDLATGGEGTKAYVEIGYPY
jgi:hypothetical protein